MSLLTGRIVFAQHKPKADCLNGLLYYNINQGEIKMSKKVMKYYQDNLAEAKRPKYKTFDEFLGNEKLVQYFQHYTIYKCVGDLANPTSESYVLQSKSTNDIQYSYEEKDPREILRKVWNDFFRDNTRPTSNTVDIIDEYAEMYEVCCELDGDGCDCTTEEKVLAQVGNRSKK